MITTTTSGRPEAAGRYRKAGKAPAGPGDPATTREIADDDVAILGAEARAIYHELREDYELALRLRQREISLMDRLYEEVRRSKLDSDTANWALQDRGMEEYKARQKIVHALTERLAAK
ncbi:MAG: hypothetical protein WBC44_09950 [Planctomycetaceae bacterium]